MGCLFVAPVVVNQPERVGDFNISNKMPVTLVARRALRRGDVGAHSCSSRMTATISISCVVAPSLYVLAREIELVRMNQTAPAHLHGGGERCTACCIYLLRPLLNLFDSDGSHDASFAHTLTCITNTTHRRHPFFFEIV